MKKALVVFNPTAGLNTKHDVEGWVKDTLEDLKYQVEIFYLNKNFERNIFKKRFHDVKLVLAVGGDGTVKVAARTMIQKGIKAPLAIVPFGSANVIAVSLKIPVNVRQALKLLKKKKIKKTKIDVGLINKKHYFLVGFSIGYVSKIVTGTSKGLKNRFGFFGYFFRLIFNKIKIRKIRFDISNDKYSFTVKGNSLIIFNALNYFGIKTKKEINISDGIFNLYVLTNRTFFTLFWAFFYMIVYQEPPRYVFNADGGHFKIKFTSGLRSCQIDGDYIKLDRNVVDIEVLKKAITIISAK